MFVLLIATLSFGLGRLSKIEERREPIRVELTPPPPPPLAGQVAATSPTREQIGLSGGVETEETANGRLVASKNSTKYHLPWCPGALRIKEENKIWFATAEEAENRGYAPAANCPGLK